MPIGIALTVVVSTGSAVYALATWGGDNRDLILAISIAGLLTAPLIAALPMKRVVESRWREGSRSRP